MPPVTVPPPLTASIAASPLLGVAPLNVTFLGSEVNGTAAPYVYNWTFGDGTTGNGTAVIHEYADAATYLVRLTVTEGGNRSANATVHVRVVAPLSVNLTAPTLSGLAPLTANFTALPVGGAAPYNFSWYFGDGGGPVYGAGVEHTFAAPGNFTVSVRVADSLVESAQTSRTVSVGSGFRIVSLTNVSVSAPCGSGVAEYRFEVNSTGGPTPISFTWTYGSDYVGSGPTLFLNVTREGVSVVNVTALDGWGDVRTGSSSVNVSTLAPTCPSPKGVVPQVVFDAGLAAALAGAVLAAIVLGRRRARPPRASDRRTTSRTDTATGDPRPPPDPEVSGTG